MSGEEELAFLKAHLGELSPGVLRQLKRDIVAEKKRREAEAAAKAKGSGQLPTGQPSGRQPGSAGGGGGDFGLPEGPPEPQRASVKPTSWTRPTRAVPWNPPLGARATVRSGVRASARTGKGKLRPRPGGLTHRFHERTSRVKRPANQLR
jgi:hypothetical protein